MIGFYLDSYGKCRKCETDCKICDESGLCLISTNVYEIRDILTYRNRKLTCTCFTVSCYRKLDNVDICTDCDSNS